MSPARVFRLFGLIFTAILLTALTSEAQQLSVSGTVDDTFGVVPEVTVTLKAPSGATQTTRTNGQGKYAFDGLTPGAYQLSVAKEGFTTATITVSLATQSRTADMTLSIAGFVQTVDVIDAAGKTTASRMDVASREIPSQVSIVSQTTLREQGVNDLNAALENVSGVITQVQYGVYQWYTVSGITQQSGNDFLYVDGMAMTGNRSNTQLNNIEQVEVFKGPNAVLYGGAGAGQGGMVNIVRKKPQAARAGELFYKMGRWGLQEGGAGVAGQVFGMKQLFYRSDIGFSNTDGWRQAGSTRFNFSPALTWIPSDRVRVTLLETFIRDRYDLDAGIPQNLIGRAAGFPLDRRLNPATDFQLTRDWQNQVLVNVNLTKHLQFREAFFKRINRDQYLDAETLSYNATTDVLTRGELYFQHNRRPTENTTDLLGDFTLAKMRHRFMVGYDFTDHDNFTNRIASTAGASNNLTVPVAPINIASFLAGTFVDTTPTYENFPRTRVDFSDNRVNAGYWQDQIDVTSRLRINLAGRYDDYNRRAHNDSYNNDVFVSEGVTTTRHQTNYAYRAGAVYAVTDNHWVYASASSTFQPVFTIPADGKEFEPTRSRSWEIGHKFEALRGRLVATSAFRRITNYNILLPLPTAGLFEQAGRSSSRAFDVDLEGNLSGGYHLLGSYGYADPKFDDFRSTATGTNLAGNRLQHAPAHTARLWGTKSFTLDGKASLFVSLGGRYVHDYFTNSTNTITLPSRLTFDGAIGFRQRVWDVTVNLVNLTNQASYFVSVINSSQFYPGQPFNASVTLRFRFN